MKKILTFILACTLIFSLAGCQNKVTDTNQPSKEEQIPVKDSLEILTNVWSSYKDENKFYAIGGDYNNITDDKPGKFDINDKEGLHSLLIVPKDAAEMIDDAANLMHAMNTNVFTSSCFHITDSANMDKFITSLQNAVLNNQWMCGSPELFIIAQINNDYVVSAFGSVDLIKDFQTQLIDQYPSAKIAVEETF